MRYLINLIDVDGTQLVFSSEMALNLAAVLLHIGRFQRKAIAEGWHKAHITVEAKGVSLSYRPTDQVTYQVLEHDVATQLEASIEAELAKPCPPAPELPWGRDQIDYPDATWSERYDAGGPGVVRGEAEITEAEAADLNAWLASLPDEPTYED